ncbi:MAG: hypothetical protein JRI25_22835, partial [Deltaproteobacteria bacterium]|nr:hypothetical protein [Deltaproteobacteria bacterium]
VISAVRLAEALASLRDLPRPGLAELREAAGSVLGAGAPAMLDLVRERLEVGGVIGTVPDDAPAVPLQQDVRAKQRRLRLKPSPEVRELDLDLRKDSQRARSRLLHQLSAIDVPWGRPRRHPGEDLGTFHERWTLLWDPELEVRLVEASVWGNTTEEAAAAALGSRAEQTAHLPELTRLLDQALLADLPPVVSVILALVARQAAVSADIAHLLEALPPLARVARYGDVRQTPVEQLRTVIDGLFERVVVGLPAACRSLADDAATAMAKRVTAVDEALGLLDRADLIDTWHPLLHRVVDTDDLPGILRGRACRILVERGWMEHDALLTHARLALSRAVPPAHAAAWLEGLVSGSGLLLLHLHGLWDALDHWLVGLDEAAFIASLPILRRAFSEFGPGERRAMGQRVRGLTAETPGQGGAPVVDPERAARVLPVLRQILVASRFPPDP